MEKEAEGRSGRLIDQKYRIGFRRDRREAVFLFVRINSRMSAIEQAAAVAAYAVGTHPKPAERSSPVPFAFGCLKNRQGRLVRGFRQCRQLGRTGSLLSQR